MLGIELDDQDVLNVPLLATDPYGHFMPGAGPASRRSSPATGAGDGRSGTPGAPGRRDRARVRTGHAFLDDIAHHAAPFGDHDNDPRRRTSRSRRTRGRHDRRPQPGAPTTTSCSTRTSSPATAAATRTSA